MMFNDKLIGKKVLFVYDYFQNGNGLTCKAGTIGTIEEVWFYHTATVRIEGRKRLVKLYNNAVDNGDVQIIEEV